MDFRKGIFWFRRDLRLSDNRALFEATHNCQKVFPVFVFDTTILSKLRNKNDQRVSFIYESLMKLKSELKEQGSDLCIVYGDPREELPRLADELKVDAVFCNEDYEPSAIERDRSVYESLKSVGRHFLYFKDQVIFSANEILKADASPYRVFTPYKKAWLAHLRKEDYQNYSCQKEALSTNPLHKRQSQVKLLSDISFERSELFVPAGEHAAQKQFQNFLPHCPAYKKQRDFPSLDKGTSKLSVHLRFGTLSIRSLVRKALTVKNEGGDTWLSELIWRDFYQMILAKFPHVVNENFNPKYRKLRWPGKKAHFEAWCEGRTGFPIVDAAMRAFNQTGWMHNRLRMIVASFLCKDLLVDWRKGEEYFAEHLIDFDLAANNGGWQWSASTGCDAQPYFRVFNPFTQSKKFDADGTFIRRYVPELQKFSDKSIHEPHLSSPLDQELASCRIGREYPAPIVEHSEQRLKAIALFKS